MHRNAISAHLLLLSGSEARFRLHNDMCEVLYSAPLLDGQPCLLSSVIKDGRSLSGASTGSCEPMRTNHAGLHINVSAAVR